MSDANRTGTGNNTANINNDIPQTTVESELNDVALEEGR